MAFQVPASKKSIGQDKFEFEIDGETHSITRAKFLSIGTQLSLDSADAQERITILFGEPGSKLGDAVRGLDSDQFDALMDAYNEDSDVAPGESQGS
jgi:hypothetical protein